MNVSLLYFRSPCTSLEQARYNQVTHTVPLRALFLSWSGSNYTLTSAGAGSVLDHAGPSPSRFWPGSSLAAGTMPGWPFPDKNGSCHSLLPERLAPRPALAS